MKWSFLVATIVALPLLNIAQLPTLDVTKPSKQALEKADGIDKARLYYNQGDYSTAQALLYSQLEKNNLETQDYLLFANTLNALGKFSLAKEFFNEYRTKIKDMSIAGYDQISEIVSNEVETQYDIKKVIDSENNLPTLFEGKIYYSEEGKIYRYDIDCDGNLVKEGEVLRNLTDKYINSVAFYNNGNNAVLSMMSEDGNPELWSARKTSKGWKGLKKLFKSTKGAVAYPYVDANSNILYFSSNMAGGFGGYDIYFSVINESGFGEPLNLGSNFNTSQNEISPIKTDNWLYFSSNGLMSKGGYDIYKYQNFSEFNSAFRNVSAVNSSQDEYGLYNYGQTKYLVSKRKGEQIELYQYSKEEEKTKISGVVIDEEGNGIPEATLLLDATEKVGGNYIISGEGGYFFYTSPDELNLRDAIVFAEGYENTDVNLRSTNKVVLRKRLEEAIVVNTNIVSADENNEEPGTKARVDGEGNEYTDMILEPIHTDPPPPEYTYTYKDPKYSYYIIIGSFTDYNSALVYQNRWKNTFDGLELIERNPNQFRVGYYAGETVEEAKEAIKLAKQKKEKVWILPPSL